jgi:hypothetical protein
MKLAAPKFSNRAGRTTAVWRCTDRILRRGNWKTAASFQRTTEALCGLLHRSRDLNVEDGQTRVTGMIETVQSKDSLNAGAYQEPLGLWTRRSGPHFFRRQATECLMTARFVEPGTEGIQAFLDSGHAEKQCCNPLPQLHRAEEPLGFAVEAEAVDLALNMGDAKNFERIFEPLAKLRAVIQVACGTCRVQALAVRSSGTALLSQQNASLGMVHRESPRPILENSPSARTSNGFLIVGTRVAPAS